MAASGRFLGGCIGGALSLDDGLAAAADLAAAAQPVAQPVRLRLQLAHRSTLHTLVRKHAQHSAPI